jgi:hypothetical protein
MILVFVRSTYLYTDPMKLRGTDSWNKSPLTSTKSPTVAVPSTICCAVSIMIPVIPTESIAPCPKFKRLNDCCACMAAFWYPFRDCSYRSLTNKRKNRVLIIRIDNAMNTVLKKRNRGTHEFRRWCLHFVWEVIEELDCLIVDERINNPTRSLVLQSIHVTAKFCSPLGDTRSKSCIRCNCSQYNRRVG